MEKRDTRPFQSEATITIISTGWNIVELESRRDLRRNIDALIHLALYNATTTPELQQSLTSNLDQYGPRFITLLVRSLYTKNAEKRQAVVQLLTLLNSPEAIPQLQSIADTERLSRSIRLSASLALAGMSATPETRSISNIVHTYAIS